MNNSKTRGRIRRLLAIWMSLAMVFSAVPAAFFAVYADSAQSDLSTGQAILQQENIVPTELKGSKALPPSVFENDPVLTGADDNGSSPFLLSEYNELFLFRNGGETHDGIKSLGAWYFLGEDENGIDMTRTSLDSDGYSWVETINTENVEAVEPDFSGTRLDDYSFMAGTSFDPLGSGRKQYAAYVGWEETGSGGVMSVMIYDPVSGDYKASALGNADWVKRADPHYFEMQNVMAITAGDYDGDGKDSLIAFCCGDGSDLRLYEVTYNGTRLSTSEVFNIDAYLVYKDYLNTSEKASFLMRHKPVVSLATGDFDGDGLDEFAYSAGFYNGTNDAEDGWNGKFGSSPRDFSTHVAVGDRKNGAWSMSDPVWLYDEALYITNSAGSQYDAYMMHGGVIGAGDTDGDGVDEIVAVGYTSVSTDNHARISYMADGTVYVSHFCDWDQNTYVTAVIESSGSSYVRTSGSLKDTKNRLAMSSFAASSLQKFQNSRFVLPKITVDCGHTNGTGQKEDVFISGVLYDFEAGYAVGGAVHTPKLMTQHFTTTMGDEYASDVYWVSDVAVGNFDHNGNGREQFIYVVMYMESGSNKYNWAYMGVEGGCKYDDEYDDDGELISFGECTAYGGSDIRGDQSHYIDNGGSRLFRSAHRRKVSAVPICLDVNDDGVLARHNTNYYAYSDPEVKAVLQAAPYFKELNDLGAQDSGETSFTIETSFGKTNSKGWEVNFSAGIAAEAEIGCVNLALSIGGQGSWSREYEDSYEVTKSRTFTTGAKDVVVICRVPVLIYVYDIWNRKTGKWEIEGQSITVPLSPTYYLLTIKDYNNFVDEYNDMISDEGHHLIKIAPDDLPEGTSGDPFAYWNQWSEAHKGSNTSGTSLIDGVNALGTTGGAITDEWSYSEGSTASYSHSAGLYFDFTLQFGGDVVFDEAWVGAETHFEHNWLNGNSTSSTSTTGAGGTVCDIDPDALDPDLYPAEWCDAFKFSWDFGCWDRKL
ncbi:MAG: hypothetical protein IIY74_05520, partial [Firmicutes bacterium]|nr:hypothetical protein [Bacillota bacterium]